MSAYDEINKNYTFASLGFKGVHHIVEPSLPKGNKYYNTLGINKPKENIGKYLADELIKFSSDIYNGNLNGVFICGVAYMMDDSVIFVYNGTNENSNMLYSSILDRDYYKRGIKPEGIVIKDNIDYLRGFINARKPKGMVILQELPSPVRSMFHFRIVHDEESDANYNNIIEFPRKERDL